MPRVTANGIEIEYETRGDPGGRPLLLLRGLGTQLIQWPGGLLERLVADGHYVISPDNRDVGLSTHLDGAPTPSIAEVMQRIAAGDDPGVAYRIHDMAADHAGLLDAIGVEAAHVCGMSLGGAVAQQFAIDYPTRTASLISIYSTTNAPGLPGPTEEAMAALMKPAPADVDGYVAHSLETGRVFNGTAYPLDEAARANLARRCFERAFDPAGVARQMAAITASGDRTQELKNLDTRALVIHGDADPLIQEPCGRATADAIPGAQYELIPGMGHDLPDALLERVATVISKFTAGA